MVEAVGEDVTYVKPGDHVITCLSVFCGECPQCMTGHPNLCENTEVKLLPGAARRLTWKGEVLNQAFNLSVVRREHAGARACGGEDRDDMPLDRAALVGCGVMTGVGAVFHAAKVEPGATVAVIGCGGIGLSAVNGAAMAGAVAHHRDRHRAVEAGGRAGDGRHRHDQRVERRSGGGGEGA